MRKSIAIFIAILLLLSLTGTSLAAKPVKLPTISLDNVFETSAVVTAGWSKIGAYGCWVYVTPYYRNTLGGYSSISTGYIFGAVDFLIWTSTSKRVSSFSATQTITFRSEAMAVVQTFAAEHPEITEYYCIAKVVLVDRQANPFTEAFSEYVPWPKPAL